jgi:hypothetical protein
MGMVRSEAGSTVPRRQLGRYLRQLREQAGITGTNAAKSLEWSYQKIWRTEHGRQPSHPLDVKNMCELYGAADDITAALVSLARETRANGWFHAYGDAVPSWFELYVGLESAASKLRQYQPELVPGLLQTREYATAVLSNRPDATDKETEKATAVRLERQGLLTRRIPAAPILDVILSEAVLRRPIRPPRAMVEQLQHLVYTSVTLANVTLRVLPLSVGPTVASEAGAFTILDFPEDGAEPSTVYQEGPTGALYLDKPNEVATYGAIWNALADLALSEAESQETITRTIGEM